MTPIQIQNPQPTFRLPRHEQAARRARTPLPKSVISTGEQRSGETRISAVARFLPAWRSIHEYGC